MSGRCVHVSWRLSCRLTRTPLHRPTATRKHGTTRSLKRLHWHSWTSSGTILSRKDDRTNRIAGYPDSGYEMGEHEEQPVHLKTLATTDRHYFISGQQIQVCSVPWLIDCRKSPISTNYLHYRNTMISGYLIRGEIHNITPHCGIMQ